MHDAYDFGKEGPVYTFECYDGTPLDLEETGALLESRKILLKPRNRHTNPEIQSHMNDIVRDYRAGHYPKWIMLTGTYVDVAGQTWIRGWREEKGEEEVEVVDYLFNVTYWAWA